jgi:uncharacterized protein YecT (DUF1311 family)
MKKIFTILVTAFMFIGCIEILALSKPQEKHLIDIKEEDCLKSKEGSTTIEINICINEAEKEWDKELNKNYAALMKNLDADEKKNLKISQRQWLEYRDSEINFMKKFYKKIPGTVRSISFAERKKEITKNRALELGLYYTM